MKTLLAELRKDLRGLAGAEIKAVEYYKKTAGVLLELASVDAINKKELISIITETLEKKGMSESSIKKIRGGLMAFYEGAKKFPDKIETIKIRLENINTRQSIETLGRVFKKTGETEMPQKEIGPKPKGSKKDLSIVEVDKSKYYKIVSSIIKIDETTYYMLDDDKIVELIQEVEKIAKILGKIKG